jgi:[lysine-biosynthesis-protein LysW]---L-2-aminoadipate ligase
MTPRAKEPGVFHLEHIAQDVEIATERCKPLAAVGEAAAFVIGRRTETNARLAAAFAERGYRSAVHAPRGSLTVRSGDLVLTRLDVLPTLDGVEAGLRALKRVERAGATLLNGPSQLLTAHDKLATALALGRSGVPHPRTTHVREARVPESFGPPYVVKPRFGSWGRDVFLCETRNGLLACLDRLSYRRWFRRHGALVQELVRPTGRDLRVVVAGGQVVGAVERLALPGEWRTNVALGAVRLPVEPPLEAHFTALRAAASLGVDLAGVDLMTTPDGTHVVLEVNGAVDFTAEYGLPGSDPFLATVDALVDARIQPALALAT